MSHRNVYKQGSQNENISQANTTTDRVQHGVHHHAINLKHQHISRANATTDRVQHSQYQSI